MTSNDDFQNMVKQHFDYLVIDHNAQSTSGYRDGNSFVRFELRSVWLELIYDPREDSVVLEFGRNASGERFDFHMYVGLKCPLLYYQFGACVAFDQNRLNELIQLYSQSLQEYGLDILNDSEDAFKVITEAASSGKGLCPPYYKQNSVKSRFDYQGYEGV